MRYVDDTCLHRLGVLGSVNWMFDRVCLSHFYARKDATYARLTREFISSLIYTIQPGSASTSEAVHFRMFNNI